MNKIPTAEEFYKSIVGETPSTIDQCSYTLDVIIGFAKLHCRAQLTAILSNVTINNYNAFGQHDPHVDYESIDKAYPLENIK
jgi:hypothetical protein